MEAKSKLPGQNWTNFWHWFSLGMLVLAWGVTLTDAEPSAGQKILATALSLLWGAWYVFFVIRTTERNSWSRAATFLFAYLLSSALVMLHPIFYILIFSFYGITFGSLNSRFAIPLVILLSILIVTLLTYTTTGTLQIQPEISGSFLLSTGFAIIFGLYIEALYKSGRNKQEMIDRLQATQQDLALAERQAGMLEERQRLAGEIHDTLAQGFTSIVMQLEAAEAALDTRPETARTHLAQASRTARESLTAARRYLWALRPDVLESEPLAKSLTRLVERFSEESRLPANLEISGNSRPLPPALETTLIRIAQEGLANVRKHAQARTVTLTLTYFADQIVLDVQDDGQGLSPSSQSTSSGYGLISLRERLTQLNGTLDIESTPGEGTTLVAAIPLQKEPV
ncbi:MAG TPA: sensor histidine kinase [Anaerolineales bacterium]|nr:sensor histidine kinase [Anaerolineales bacterium]